MSAKIVRPEAFGSSDQEDEIESPLFDEISTLNEHELAATIGSVRPPSIPFRQLHPLMSKFANPHTTEAMDALIEDIRRNGQRKAIAMFEGYVWDGRARYNACLALRLVPKVFMLRDDPILYLIHRHDPSRYGEPNSPERVAALKILQEARTIEWKQKQKKERAEWLAYARDEFRQLDKVAGACAVCDLDRAYSHAHHLLPLNVQYAIGIDTPVQDYDWLCHVHHKMVHRLFSAYLTPTHRNYEFPGALRYRVDKPEHATKAEQIFEQGYQLFKQAGGIAVRGNWSKLSPW